MKPEQNSTGYLNIKLVPDKKHKHFYIHVLVANAFIPNPDNLPEINHLDGDKFNCHVSNLELSTRSGNNKHAFKNGFLNLPTKKPLCVEKFIKRTIKNMSNIIHGKTYKDA